MIDSILTALGFVFKQGRFTQPPSGDYAVYFDDIARDGADRVTPSAGSRLPGVYHHDGKIELYEEKPNPRAEASLEDELDAWGLDWTKQDRYWIQDVQRYQVVYEFSWTSKTR